MSAYDRLKKFRILKRLVSSNSSDDIASPSDTSQESDPMQRFPSTSSVQLSEASLPNSVSRSDSPELHSPPADSLNESQASLSNDENLIVNEEPAFAVKLQIWANKNIRNMTRDCVTELLKPLKKEGHDVPTSAATLLKTRRYSQVIRPMENGKGTMGKYVYFGVQENLKNIIPEDYNKRIVKLSFNVDGVPIYNRSSMQFWTFLGKVYDNQYDSWPFIIAIFCGDSKPISIREFLEDFITEMSLLMEDGVTIRENVYVVEISNFSCDTPARALIKCVKGHGGFYACERCQTKGRTVNRKRVYPCENATLRTERSFKRQSQKQHHVGRSPLVDLPHFDPVKSVLLESLHLRDLGIQKWLLEEWLGTKKRKNRQAKLGRRNIKLLEEAFKTVSGSIPAEFQRKTLNLNDFSYWKGTQFRFCLLYCGVIFLRDILPRNMYRHYRLLVVAFRLLCDPSLAVDNAPYARELLQTFFRLLPTYYGRDSQIMNNHNLIHIADDVEHMNGPLPDYSAYCFENFLGYMKCLIKGRRNPLEQLVASLSQLKSGPETKQKFILRRKQDVIIDRAFLHQEYIDLEKVTFNDCILTVSRPNNFVQIESGKILQINRIRKQNGNIFIEGYVYIRVMNIFNHPCASTDIGFMELGRRSEVTITVQLNRIIRKCIVFEYTGKTFAITLLHSKICMYRVCTNV